MSADLRRLAEAGIAGTVGRVTPETWQAILALLDERARWKKEATVRAGQTALFRRERNAAKRRVAALEEGLRALIAAIDNNGHQLSGSYDEPPGTFISVGVWLGDLEPEYGKARALLAAAPSEPHVGIGPVDGGRIEEWPVPAALPAEVEE